MFQSKANKGASARARGRAQKTAAPVYSIAGLLKEREFVGSFDASGSSYKFTYAPSKAEIEGNKLRLEGRLSVTNSRGNTREKENIRALLASTQGGLGAAPIRRQLLVGGVRTETAATPNQQQEIAGDKQAATGKKAEETAGAKMPAPPETESTGSSSFTGVMYFQFEPLDGKALGITADLNRVQLNARLAPVDNSARDLQGIYSSIVDALYGERVDNETAKAYVSELNKLLGIK